MQEPVVIGRVAGAYGVRGWVHIQSFTEQPTDILDYRPWLLHAGGQWRDADLVEAKGNGGRILARFSGVVDRDAAQALAGARIGLDPAQLPSPPSGSYYWRDLTGLRVITLADVELGRVKALMETGANDVLIVEGDHERLIPWIPDVIRDVDLKAGQIRVDWDPDY